MPLWAGSLLLFGVFYLVGAFIAFETGEWPRSLVHPRNIAVYVLPAFAAFTMGYAPRKMADLWTRMKPWLVNPPEDIERLERETPDILMRPFWVVAGLWFLSAIGVAFTGSRMTDLESFRYVSLATALFSAYFMGGAAAIAIGLSLFMYRFQKWADFRPGFILQGGKDVLRPFNHLVWMTWALLTLPILLLVVATFTLQASMRAALPPATFHVIDLLPVVLGIVAFMAIVVVPEFLMFRLLAREKAQEMQAITEEMRDLGTLPSDVLDTDILRSMHRRQTLAYLERKAHDFVPTLVDARLMLQVLGAVATIASATYALQRLLSSTSL